MINGQEPGSPDPEVTPKNQSGAGSVLRTGWCRVSVTPHFSSGVGAQSKRKKRSKQALESDRVRSGLKESYRALRGYMRHFGNKVVRRAEEPVSHPEVGSANGGTSGFERTVRLMREQRSTVTGNPVIYFRKERHQPSTSGSRRSETGYEAADSGLLRA